MDERKTSRIRWSGGAERHGPGLVLPGLRTARGAVGVVALAALGANACGGDDPASVNPQPPPPPGSAAYVLEYGSFLGGNDDEEAREPVLLSDSRLLFGMRTKSSGMPTTAGAVQRDYGGGVGDSYVAILSADGSRLEAATYFGGSGMERPPYGIALFSNGDIAFGSGTTSPNIPTSPTAYRRNLHSPVPDPGDGYVCRISSDLRSLRWCTYTGGGWPRGGLMVDGQDNLIVVGRVTGSNFATTSGAPQTQARGRDDAFVLRLDSSGSNSLFSTRLGGSGQSIGEVAFSVRTTPTGEISVVGNSQSMDFPTTAGAAQVASSGPVDAFMALIDPATGSLVYSTLLGGSGDDYSEHRHWLLEDGTVLSTGTTVSGDFPATAGTRSGQGDAFLARLRPDGTAFEMVRLLGGSGGDLLLGPVVDGRGNIYAFGSTSSRDITTTADALQRGYAGGGNDALLYVLSPGGNSILYATYVGGSGDELIRGLVVGPGGELYLVGTTTSADFPVSSGALQSRIGGGADGFVLKLVPTGGG